MITTCKSAKDELVQEVDDFNQRRLGSSQDPPKDYPPFEYLSYFQSDSTYVLGAGVGAQVVTVAFLRG